MSSYVVLLWDTQDRRYVTSILSKCHIHNRNRPAPVKGRASLIAVNRIALGREDLNLQPLRTLLASVLHTVRRVTNQMIVRTRQDLVNRHHQ
jgi:hypothetical protein